MAIAVTAWILVAIGVVWFFAIMPTLGWTKTAFIVLLATSPVLAVWMTLRLRTDLRVQSTVPDSVLEQRYHGTFDQINEAPRRSLRSVGVPATDVAARTGALLGELAVNPSVRIFRGVRPVGPDVTPTTHVIAAGRSLILVESVAWPAGVYRTDGDGRIQCDNVYIGQSVASFVATMRYWRNILPRGHRVSGVIVVHGEGGIDLPESTDPNLVWSLSDRAIDEIRARMPRRHTVSRHAVAALVAATPGNRQSASRVSS